MITTEHSNLVPTLSDALHIFFEVVGCRNASLCWSLDSHFRACFSAIRKSGSSAIRPATISMLKLEIASPRGISNLLYQRDSKVLRFARTMLVQRCVGMNRGRASNRVLFSGMEKVEWDSSSQASLHEFAFLPRCTYFSRRFPDDE